MTKTTSTIIYSIEEHELLEIHRCDVCGKIIRVKYKAPSSAVNSGEQSMSYYTIESEYIPNAKTFTNREKIVACSQECVNAHYDILKTNSSKIEKFGFSESSGYYSKALTEAFRKGVEPKAFNCLNCKYADLWTVNGVERLHCKYPYENMLPMNLVTKIDLNHFICKEYAWSEKEPLLSSNSNSVVSVDELIKEFEGMAQRGSILEKGSQEDRLLQIIGTITKVVLDE